MLLIASLGFALACQPSAVVLSNPQEPAETIGARDVVAEFKLPPLLDGASDTVWVDEQNTQVLTRAKMLHVDEHSATEAWAAAQADLHQAAVCEAWNGVQARPVQFYGTLASELNKLLERGDTSSVVVMSPQLQIDTPIVLGRNGVDLDIGRAELVDATAGPYMIRVEGAANVTLRGGVFIHGNWGVLIARSSNIVAERMTMKGLTGGGVLVTGSNDVTIRRNLFQSLGSAPVLLHGTTQRARVLSNEILDSRGPSNWQAGIVLTDRNADLESNPRNLFSSDGYWVPEQPMATRLNIPQNNLIAYNHVAGNASSGIYSDGSMRNIIVNNQVENNSKEGLCLDNGSAADVVAFNQFRGNGKRWGESALVLELDSVLQFGMLPDGTSPAKLPGISMDNTVYDQVVFNDVDENFGSGIKMVRTAFYNLVGINTLTDNNRGQSNVFHFFGIEHGFAAADTPSTELDFAPSRGNIVFGNNVRGAHYSGIFFAQGSDQNNLFDNTIFGATDWGMESVVMQANITLNNLTNLSLRHVSSGLEPSFCASH
jgi:parallel beta-helix repeat protein